LHEKLNTIHLDVKPENVLLTNSCAKLCDFGRLVSALPLCLVVPLMAYPQARLSQPSPMASGWLAQRPIPRLSY